MAPSQRMDAASPTALVGLGVGALPRPVIALLGLRCSGKSTVGALLAAALGRALVDLDGECLRVARCSGWRAASVGELLDRAGEAAFRELEASALRAVLEPSPRVVLATGGGTVERPDNRTWLARTARCFYLSVASDVLVRRLEVARASRPAFLGLGAGEEVRVLLARREPLFLALSEGVIECGTRTSEDLARELLLRLAP